MHSKKKKLLNTILTGNSSCGCGRANPSDVYEPTPKPKAKTFMPSTHTNPSSSSSSCCRSGHFSMENEEDCTSTTITCTVHDNITSPVNSEFKPDPKASKIVDSIAVVKDSNNPYEDFKHSMLQMIFEKEIYSGDDLQDLLSCFLELNSPSHHELILQVFSQIWNEVISKRLPSQKPCVGKTKK